ncbi:hypothetical protein AMJ80_10810 [bacterium SM23_31]|nr:MAG: hypothetical protein AMJ80_10810 [bacterium SM23_31]
MKHLLDSDFQDYLDGNCPPNDNFIRKHLKTCEMCRRRLEQYNILYAGLNKEIAWVLPDSFADNLIAELPDRTAPLKAVYKFLSSEVFLTFAGIAAALGAVLYYIDFQVFMQFFYDIFKLEFDFTPLREEFTNIITLLNLPGLSFLLSGVLVLLIIGALDRFIIQNLIRT